MKKINKKIIFSSIAIAGLIPVAAIIASCAKTKTREQNKISPYLEDGSNFGLAIDAINTLNYVKFASLRKIVFSLVDGLIKEAPSTNSTIGNLLGISKLYLNQYRNPVDAGFNNMTDAQLAGMKISPSYVDLSSFGINTGVLAPTTSEDDPTWTFYNNSNNRIVATKFTTNFGASKWSDGKEVNAQDFIDAIQYILDLNTGSQLRSNLLRFNIKGTNAFNNAQEEYIRKHGVPYKNPFGRAPYILNKQTGEWEEDFNFVPYQNQTFDKNGRPVDDLEIAAIKKAAYEIGLSTGKAYTNISNEQLKEALKLPENKNFKFQESKTLTILNPKYDHTKPDKNIPEKIVINLIENPSFNHRQKLASDNLQTLANSKDLFKFNSLPTTRFDLLMEFETYAPKPSFSVLLTDILGNQALLPVNRRFIETHGGIEKFGSTLDNFVWSGPFNISEVVLGPQGYMTLEKNKDYFSANWTISDKIKIYFNSKNEVTSLWFEQGMISSTTVPPSYQLKFWAQSKMRDLMKKQAGAGTVAMQFNLDRQSRYDSYEEYLANPNKDIPILDPDLRRAIAFAINRENVLKLSGWTSSFPVTTWTSFQRIKDSKGRNLEYWFDNQRFESEYVDTIKDKKTHETKKQNRSFLVQNNDFSDHVGAKNSTFENINRKDNGFDVEVAKFYLNKYKQKNPNKKQVVLKFVYPTEPADIGKAVIAIKDLIDRHLGGYVKLELQALPPNTFVSFANSGKFDISYQNFDKYAGSTYDSALGLFLTPDGIDLKNNKSLGYELNPTGSWTPKDFFDRYKNKEDLEYALKRLHISQEDADIIRELVTPTNIKTSEVYNPQHLTNRTDLRKLKLKDKAIPMFDIGYSEYDAKIINDLQHQIEQLKQKITLQPSNNLKVQWEKEVVDLQNKIESMQEREFYLSEEFLNQHDPKCENKPFSLVLQNNVTGEYSSLQIEPVVDVKTKQYVRATKEDYAKYYHKENIDEINLKKRFKYKFSIKTLPVGSYQVINLSYTDVPRPLLTKYLRNENNDASDKVNTEIFMTKLETVVEQRQRIIDFFSGNRPGWEDDNSIFRTILNLEKILRDEAAIVPIMEIDTNWTISSLGGMKNNYTYYLQYAYDYRRPPRPGLPTSPQAEGEN